MHAQRQVGATFGSCFVRRIQFCLVSLKVLEAWNAWCAATRYMCLPTWCRLQVRAHILCSIVGCCRLASTHFVHSHAGSSSIDRPLMFFTHLCNAPTALAGPNPCQKLLPACTAIAATRSRPVLPLAACQPEGGKRIDVAHCDSWLVVVVGPAMAINGLVIMFCSV